MDPALLLGLLIAFGSLFAMITLEGANVASLLLPAPMVLVFGATIAVGLAGGKLKDGIRAFGSLPKAFIGKTEKPHQIIENLVSLAEKARKDGLLSLEPAVAEANDPFLKTALQNLVDGIDGEEIRGLLEEESNTKSKDRKHSAKFFKALGGYAPTVGIIGTVVSLTHVLENLSEPETLGHSIAAAFVATLWGLLSANFMWLPLGDRLARLGQVEDDNRQLIIEGVLAIQTGTAPRVLDERLRAMVPDHDLPKVK